MDTCNCSINKLNAKRESWQPDSQQANDKGCYAKPPEVNTWFTSQQPQTEKDNCKSACISGDNDRPVQPKYAKE